MESEVRSERVREWESGRVGEWESGSGTRQARGGVALGYVQYSLGLWMNEASGVAKQERQEVEKQKPERGVAS